MFVTFTQGRAERPTALAVNVDRINMIAPDHSGGTMLTIAGNEYITVVKEPFDEVLAMLNGALERAR